MKTTYDAVNELKGEWKAGFNYLFISEFCRGPFFTFTCNDTDASNGYEGECVNGGWHVFSHSWVKITENEFNALVAKMEANFGECCVDDVIAYRRASKELLKPEPFIDWDNAPEGTEFIQPACGVFIETHIKNIRNNSYEKWQRDEKSWVRCNRKPNSSRVMVRRPIEPQPKPIYTQEMCDNGELPSVGMEFIDINSTHLGAVVCLFHYNSQAMYESGCQCYHSAGAEECKPIAPPTPSTPLIDSKAYQFDVDSLVINGIYRKMDNKFYNYNGDFGVEYCTNIKPLTLEGS